MARDYPDDFGFQGFPSYGAALIDEYSIITDEELLVTVHNIAGRGRIYGGFCFSAQNIPHYWDEIQVWIDGDQFIDWTYKDLLDSGITTPGQLPIYLIKYDNSSPIWCAGYSPDLTFDSSFKVMVQFTNGTQVWYLSKLYYSLYTT